MDYEHGQLSDLRDTLVSKSQLAYFARQIRLKDFALLGKGTDASNIYSTRTMAEMFEALVAAVYLGFERNMVPAHIWFCDTFLEKAVDDHFNDLEYVSNDDEYEDYGITPDDDEYLDMIGLGDSDLGGFVPGDD
jgi:ribonuclease III